MLNECKKEAGKREKVLKEKYIHSEEEAAIITSYTYEKSNDVKNSPYKVINKMLRDDKAQDQINDKKSYLHLLLRALRKLPRTKPQTLYRGINDKRTYNIGDELEWKGFSSTTMAMRKTEDFLGVSKNRKSYETMFEIRGMWGYDISDFSIFPKERGKNDFIINISYHNFLSLSLF